MPTPIRSTTLASIESGPELPKHRFLLFGVAGRLCACDLDAVREIVPARTATRLPGAPAWVCGLINLRGTLLTVIDLAARFGEQGAVMRMIIVAEGAGKKLGLGVDAVRDVDAVNDDGLETVDEQRSAGGIVRGLARVGAGRTEIALVCDVDAIARQALLL